MRCLVGCSMPLTASDVPLPSSVSSWLGHELEIRGIDAVIYTRYILSILLQDDVDVCGDDTDFPQVAAKVKQSTAASTDLHKVKRSGSGRKYDKAKQRLMERDLDVLKKRTAVECLMSVSDEQQSGIESLVDELYSKLKEQLNPTAESVSCDQYESSDSVISTSPDDPAERYYAAFPALSDQSGPLPPRRLTKPAWSEMAQKAPRQNQPVSDPLETSADEFPDSVGEFEVLEREATAASNNRFTAAKASSTVTDVAERSMSYKKKGKISKSQMKGVHESITVTAPREHFVVCQPVKTIDQIKGKAVFEDVEHGNVEEGRSLPVVLRRGDVTPSPVARNGLTTVYPAVAFIVPKVHLKENRSGVLVHDSCCSNHKQQPRCVDSLTKKTAVQADEAEKSASDEEVDTLVGTEAQEDPLWYMGPLPEVPPSPVLKDRLYNRRHSAQMDTDLLSQYMRGILSKIGDDVTTVTPPTTPCCHNATHCLSPNTGSPSLSSSVSTTVTLEPHDTPTPVRDPDFSFTEPQNSVFKLAWDQAQMREKAADVAGMDTSQLLTSSCLYDSKKNTECDSGNETDDHEFTENKLRSAVSLSSVLSWDAGPGYVSSIQPLNGTCHHQSEVTSEMLVTALSNLTSSHQDSTLPDGTDLCVERKSHCEAVNRDVDTGLSPCSDLSFSPSKLGLDSEQTGIPTPQSTENEVLDHRPVFFLTEESDGVEGFVNTPLLCSSPVRSSPDILSALACLWSDSDDGELSLLPPAGLPSSSANSTLNCDSHSLDTQLTSHISSSYGALAPDVPCISYAASYSTSRLGTWPLTDHIWRFPGSKFWSSSPEFSSTLLHSWLSNDHDLAQQSHCPVSIRLFDDTPPFSSHLAPGGVVSQIWDINTHCSNNWGSPPELRPLSSLSTEKNHSVLWNPHMSEWACWNPPNIFLTPNFSDCDLALHWLGSSGRSGSDTEIWHSVLFDYTDLMKQVVSSSEPVKSIYLEPPEMFRNASHTSLEGAEFNTSSTVPLYSELLVNGRYIVPSENSAFTTSSIPRRPSDKLQYVCSEPLLATPGITHLTSCDVGRLRLVEVKHLYKPDTSILRQLGLTSDSDDDADGIEYTPDRYFHPIQTPLGSLKSPHKSQQKTSIKPSPDEHSEPDQPIVSIQSSHYQQYQGDETTNVTFIPSFRLQKDRDKCAQTGDSPPKTSPLKDTYNEDGLAERVLQDVKAVLNIVDEETSESLELPGLNKDSSDLQHPPHNDDVSDDAAAALDHSGLASLWLDKSSQHVFNEDEETGRSPCVNRSIWSSDVMTSINPVSLPVLGSVDTGEVLPVLGGVDNSETRTGDMGGDIHSADSACCEGEKLDGVGVWSCAADDLPSLSHQDDPAYWSHEPCDEVFGDDTMQFNMLMFAGGGEQQPVPAEAPYIHELEENWINSAPEQFSIQVPKKGAKAGSVKKPCSFFMEGSCRRSDCKFSHEISHITCRFWEDGCCFKGITCPFLHGYPGDSSSGSMELTEMDTAEKFSLHKDDFPELQTTVVCRGSKTGKKEWKRKKSLTKKNSVKLSGTSAPRKSTTSGDKSLPIDIKFTQKP